MDFYFIFFCATSFYNEPIKDFEEKQNKIKSDKDEKEKLQAELKPLEVESEEIQKQIDEKNQDCDRYKVLLESLQKKKAGFIKLMFSSTARKEKEANEKKSEEFQKKFAEVLDYKQKLEKQQAEIRKTIKKNKEKIKIIEDFENEFDSLEKDVVLLKEEK